MYGSLPILIDEAGGIRCNNFDFFLLLVSRSEITVYQNVLTPPSSIIFNSLMYTAYSLSWFQTSVEREAVIAGRIAVSLVCQMEIPAPASIQIACMRSNLKGQVAI